MSQRKKGGHAGCCASGLSSFSRQIASFNLVLPFTKSKLHYQSTKTLKGLPFPVFYSGIFALFSFLHFSLVLWLVVFNNSHLHNPATAARVTTIKTLSVLFPSSLLVV